MKPTNTIIQAREDTLAEYVRKLWYNRHLITVLAGRDLKVRYAQTYLGFAWLLLQPLPSVAVFSFFFGYLLQVDTGPLPYPIFALTGMMGWNYFSNLSISSGNSVNENQQLIKKMNFPKLILPLSKVLSGGVDVLVWMIIMLPLSLFWGLPLHRTLILLPVFVAINALTGLTIGLFISSLSFKQRDLLQIAPSLINFAIWLTPVFYPTSILPIKVSWLMYLNPMAFVLAGYRYCFSGGQTPDIAYLYGAALWLVLLFMALHLFRKAEDKIIDYI